MNSLGVVVYTDGGARINPGPAGSGWHGYAFEYAHPKRGTGNPKYTLTQHGYSDNESFMIHNAGITNAKKIDKSKVKKIDDITTTDGAQEIQLDLRPYEITPTEYFDGVIAYGEARTNNYAELNALIAALKHIMQVYPTAVSIEVLSDSKYVVEGTTNYLPKWAQNNFRKQDGQTVANAELWEQVHMLKQALNQRNILLNVKHVYGHSTDLGNRIADVLASMGVNAALASAMQTGKDVNQTNTSDAQGYWKKDLDRPDFFYDKFLVFSGADGITDNTFFGYSTKAELIQIGAMQSEASFTLFRITDDSRCAEQLNLIKQVIGVQQAQLGHEPIVCLLETGNVFSKDFSDAYGLLGMSGFHMGENHKREIFTPHRKEERKQLTSVINPPYLSPRLTNVRTNMSDVAGMYFSEDKRLLKTDITDVFFEKTTTKKGKAETEHLKLKDQYKVGFKKVEVMANYGESSDNPAQAMVILLLGSDLPDRNTLKRLEDTVIRLVVCTRQLAPGVFDYVTLMETTQGWLLSSNGYSNIRILTQTDLINPKD